MRERKERRDLQLHFVGIGGIGMSGIAEVFLNQGFRVSGSDQSDSDTTRRLARLGVRLHLGHARENISGADVVVVSSAVRPDNPEIIEAREKRIPVIRRAEMLAELMRGKVGVAVAGTHGKTTTTSMLATVLSSAGWDPTLVIGGRVDSLGGNAKLGKSQFVVAEADESDGSFLQLPATYAIITNIDNDHLDHYGSTAAIDQAFSAFVAHLPFYGLAAVCGEDPGVARIRDHFVKPAVTYGFSDRFDYWADRIQTSGLFSRFEVFQRDQGRLGQVELSIPGRHNILNALAVVAISVGMGLSFEEIARGLAQFKGVKRRFEIRWEDTVSRRVIVDDYGHHPTEIAATLAAARQYWPGRILVAFQPHRFSRTLNCLDGFRTAFDLADRVFLTDIYAAGEAPLDGVDSHWLAREVAHHSRTQVRIDAHGDLLETERAILSEFQSGDLLLCMGAGSITRLPGQLISRLGPLNGA
ncbi:MAG: UDP-N-acetylmuramate--L-alanine ligase [Oligoflexia bacterium]